MSCTCTRSKVVIHQSNQEPVFDVAAQLLDVLGHKVARVSTVERAVEETAEQPTDLLVLSLTDLEDQEQAIQRLALSPAGHRPKQVAILSDAEAELAPRSLPSVPDMKVHVFVKPVHALGLLNVIKRLAQTN